MKWVYCNQRRPPPPAHVCSFSKHNDVDQKKTHIQLRAWLLAAGSSIPSSVWPLEFSPVSCWHKHQVRQASRCLCFVGHQVMFHETELFHAPLLLISTAIVPREDWKSLTFPPRSWRGSLLAPGTGQSEPVGRRHRCEMTLMHLQNGPR